MANEFVNVTQGTGTKMAADQIGDVFHPRVKLEIGDEGTASDVSLTNPMPVITANGSPLKMFGSDNGSVSPVTIGQITLAVDKTYRSLAWAATCFQSTICSIIYSNNGSETELVPVLLSSLQNTSSQELTSFEFNTIGQTGGQLLIFRAFNLDTPSTIRAMMSIREFT